MAKEAGNWVGRAKETGQLVYFQSIDTPTEASHGHLYGAVVGPFRTVRAAMWAERYGNGNPHFQHVNDAERISAD